MDGVVQPQTVEAPRFRPGGQKDLAQSGERRRVRNNLAVIRTLRLLDQEQRPATADEQKILARWSGWGAVPKVFDERSAELAAERAELLELLSPQEYQAAKTTTLTAYYTDADLVQAIWKGLHDLGFEGGNVLEPGCGSGNFIGFAPTDRTTPTRMIGVEVDPTSAAIARHLYPDAQILAESFAETIAPDGAFDAVIGNVPFDRHSLYDPRYNPTGESIHNHFIAKSVQLTKPGGVVAVITSRFTLDGDNAAFRNRLASMADLVGAFRLPRDAHASAAGTRTVTDVLFLRRREQTRSASEVIDWHELAPLPEAPELRVNRYFLDHPDHVIGTLGSRQGRFGPEVDVIAPWDRPTADRLYEAVEAMGVRAHQRGATIPLPASDWKPLELVGGRDAGRDGLMEVDDLGRLTRITDGIRVRIDPPFKNSAPELFSLLRIRDAYLELVEAERTSQVGDEHVEVLRGRLNERYDAYVGRYGPINRFGYKSNGQRNPPRLGGLRQDLMAARVLALEKFDPTTQTATKVEIFHRRTIAPAEPAQRAETAADALAISLDVYAEVRLDHIQRLLGLNTPDQAREALGTLVYTEPVTEDLIPAAQYLSGDVRAKLRAAEAAARTDERFTPNVEALREVVPVDLTPAEIEARLGATWISAEYVQQFAREILSDERVSVVNPGGSLWTVSGGNPASVLASNTWGTKKMPAHAILQNLLQNKAIRVTRIEVHDGRERTVLDQTATEAAQAKAEDMAEKFATWAWEDPDRARDLARVYNDRFNQLALCTYDGSHLTFPGLSQRFKPYPYQKEAIARVLNEQSALLAHGVGAGKTAEMVISIMEMRRLGQARKPAMVVPKHMLGEVSRDFAQLYPQAKILVADKDMMSRDYRARFADLAASGDWDAIVFSHTQFKNLPLPNEDRRAYENQRIAEYEAWITSAELDPNVPEWSVKQLERAKVQEQKRYKKLWASVDAGSATMADCGIDAIVYDEWHEAKNVMVRSNIQDAGKSQPSWMAEDLFMKGDYLRRNGGKLVYATATPVANGVAEAYVVIRSLRPDLLHAAGIYDFDQWASTFGEIISEFEMKPEGGGFQQKDRFARFMNVPELLRMFHSFADVKLSSELGLDLPDLEQPGEEVDGVLSWVEGRQTVVVPPSAELQEYMEELGERADDIRKGQPQDRWSKAQQQYRPDNMLWISSDGRAAATDLRLVDEQASAETKMAYVAEQVSQIWAEHQHDTYLDPDTDEPEARTGSLQIVFCDLGTPSNDPTRYDAYEDLRERLVVAGVPREQIRFVHEAKNDKEKADLFASARDGRTQVIVGSTKKMGTGTNMQRRAVALHHVDCPWRPVDIEQREGRLIRQGNANTRVRILSYVTEGSFDAYMWQTALRKLRFIEQIMRGKLDAREVEDVSSTAMSYAEVQALASGNPLMLEKVVIEKHVKKLERAFHNHHQSQAMLERTITSAQREVANATAAIAVYDRALEQRIPTRGEAFRMRVEDQEFDQRVDAADALRASLGRHMNEVRKGLARADTRVEVGSLGGFAISITAYYGIETMTTEVYLHAPSNRLGQYGVENTLAVVLNKHELASSTGHGIVMSLENTLGRLESQRADAVEAIPRLEAEIAHARDNLGAPFPRQSELEEALAQEAELLDTLGLPARETNVLLEGRTDSNALEHAVQEAVAVDTVRATVASSEASAAPEPREAAPPAPVEFDEPEGSDAWREESTAEERLTAAEASVAEQEQDPEPSEVEEPSVSEAESAPETGPVAEEPADPTPTSTPAVEESSSTAPTTSEEEPVRVGDLRWQAEEAITGFSLKADQRTETDEELRARLHSAIEELFDRGEYRSVSEMVRRANRVDRSHVLEREHYRSRADIENPGVPEFLMRVWPVRIDDDFSPGGTGVIRHINGARRQILREVLIREGFWINEAADDATLSEEDPERRKKAWRAVLAETERVEGFAGSSHERVFEEQWQEALRRVERSQTLEAETEVDQTVEVSSVTVETAPEAEATASPAEAEPATAQEQAAPQQQAPEPTPTPHEETVQAPSVSDEEAEELPQAPEDPLQASDAPDTQARAAVRRLHSGFDPAARAEDRRIVEEGLTYLVDAHMPAQALDLLREANRADPAGAWAREERRSALMWQGAESEKRALHGPVIRIEHDGGQNTVVRGTDKDDTQVRSLLKELKFRWSRRYGFWHLMRSLNSPEQARRVSRLLSGLEELGRDRITETHWKALEEQEREAKRERSREVIEGLRPEVEEIMRTAQQQGLYRQALTSLDALHQGLLEQGHVNTENEFAEWRPFAEQRTELLSQARELSQQILDRFNAIMRSSEPDLVAAWTLLGELEVTAPARDVPAERLERTRKALLHRFEQAGMSPPEQASETGIEEETADVEEQQVETTAVEASPEVEQDDVEQPAASEPEARDQDDLEEPELEKAEPVQATTPEEVEASEPTLEEVEEHTPQEQEAAPPEPDHEEEPAPASVSSVHDTLQALRQQAAHQVEQAQQSRGYRAALALLHDLQQTMMRSLPVQEAAEFADWPPLETEIALLTDQARDLTRQGREQLHLILETPQEQASLAQTREALRLLEQMGREAPEQDVSDRELAEWTSIVHDRLDHVLDRASSPTAAPPEPRVEHAPAPEGPLPEPEPDAYDAVPDDLYEQDDAILTPGVPPLRSSIDISGVEAYPDKDKAERAGWWIAHNGVERWAGTVTAAEMAAPRSLPADDVMALDRALHQVREDPLAGGAGPAAVRYADLSGAATMVGERVDDDRQHLAQAAALASEHAARLLATREYNLARMQGAAPAQLRRLEERQGAIRYTGADEAREMSQAVATVVGRWAATTTSRQMRDSLAQGVDVARVRQVWSQVAEGGLDGGPGPAAARFEGFARAVGELSMRLEAETGHLRRLAAVATRHAARLAATQQAMATSTPVGERERPTAVSAHHERPAYHRAQAADSGQDLGR